MQAAGFVMLSYSSALMSVPGVRAGGTDSNSFIHAVDAQASCRPAAGLHHNHHLAYSTVMEHEDSCYGSAATRLDAHLHWQIHRVGSLPSVHYKPDYISVDDEERLLREVRASKAWTQVSGRRLQNHGGIVHAKGLIPAPIPSWLQPVMGRLHDTGAYGNQPPNHVLINAYAPGEGIMAHEDGPAYHPCVCILSLGAPAVLRFRRKRDDGNSTAQPPTMSVLLMPRSVVVFSDDAYTQCLHGIDAVHEEQLDGSIANLDMYGLEVGSTLPRERERVSFTVRRVNKTVGGFLLGGKR